MNTINNEASNNLCKVRYNFSLYFKQSVIRLHIEFKRDCKATETLSSNRATERLSSNRMTVERGCRNTNRLSSKKNDCRANGDFRTKGNFVQRHNFRAVDKLSKEK